MKKITLLFASLLSVAYIAVAQLKLYVYQNDGTRTEFVASIVDSIAFSTVVDTPNQPDVPNQPDEPTTPDDPAKPEETFTLLFNSNGGKGSMPAIEGEKGDKVTIPTSTFTLDGYDFVGWNTKSNGTGTAYTAGQSITLNANLTLYAQWEEVEIIERKLYFVNTKGWSSVGVYTWIEGTVTSNAKWPGEPATKESITFDGYSIYSYNITSKEQYDMIIFNNNMSNGYQTKDLEIDYSKPYCYGGVWYSSLDDIYEGISKPSGYHNSHGYVDLGLPSGTLWATMNVGADTPEEYGNYYAWGEIKTKSSYTSSNYTYSSDLYTLPPSDDAANANWGRGWRMPTEEEQRELVTACTWTWETKNNVNGYTVTGPNGNSIFLPAAGYRFDSALINAGSYGYYWGSSLYTIRSDYASSLRFYSNGVDWTLSDCYHGHSVRPVLRVELP